MIAIYSVLTFLLAPILFGGIIGIFEKTPPEEYVENVNPLLLTEK